MLPESHFIGGLFLGLIAWKLGLLSWKLALLAGIIAVLVDIDHWLAYHFHHGGDWSLWGTWMGAFKYHEVERTFIHQFTGFLAMSGIIILLYFVAPVYGFALAIGYYSHYLLDMVHIHYDKKLREGSIVIPLSYMSLALDLILSGSIVAMILV